MSDAYLHHIIRRIVGMFELYRSHVDPDNPDLQTFVKRYLSTKDTRETTQMPYSELYRYIREGVREYIRKTQETKDRPYD
jgi:hypothetical protein